MTSLQQHIEKRREQLRQQALEVAARMRAQATRIEAADTLEKLAVISEVYLKTPEAIAARANELLAMLAYGPKEEPSEEPSDEQPDGSIKVWFHITDASKLLEVSWADLPDGWQLLKIVGDTAMFFVDSMGRCGPEEKVRVQQLLVRIGARKALARKPCQARRRRSP